MDMMTATMVGLKVDAQGRLEQLRTRTDLPVPSLEGPNDARASVAALNHLGWWVLNGIHGAKTRSEGIVGSDGAGEVAAVGPDVRGVSLADTP